MARVVLCSVTTNRAERRPANIAQAFQSVTSLYQFDFHATTRTDLVVYSSDQSIESRRIVVRRRRAAVENSFPSIFQRHYPAACVATPSGADAASEPRVQVVSIRPLIQRNRSLSNKSSTLLFQPFKLFPPLIPAINPEIKWRLILLSLFGVLLREVFGQEVEKPSMIDDRAAPERRVGIFAGLGCKEHGRDTFCGAFFVHDVLVSFVDDCGDPKGLFSAQAAFELEAWCSRFGHVFREVDGASAGAVLLSSVRED